MYYEIENELTPHLTTGEKLVWAGKPKTGILLRPSDTFVIPFSIMWGGFAFFWETTALLSGGPSFMAIWGIPFVAAGIYMIIGRFFVDARKRANTVYGITENRILILSGVFSRSVQSLHIKTIPQITFTEKTDLSGSIVFGTGDIRQSMPRGIEWPGAKQIPAFEFIPEVKNVYSQIIALQNQK